MPQPIVFGDHASIFVRAILIALTEKDVAFGLLEESELLRTGFAQRLPGEPAIEHGGFLLCGVDTILRYVDEALPGPRLQPEAALQRARMNRALELYFREAVPVLGGQILMRNLAQAFTDEWTSPTLPERIAGAAQQTIGRLSQVLDEGPFFAGDMFTLADAAVAPLFDYLLPLPECNVLIPPASALRCWWQRMLNRESLQSTRPKDGVFAVLLPVG